MQQVEQLLLRPAEAARALGCSRTRVYELIYSGDLPHLRLGGTSLRVPKAAIDRMIDSALERPTQQTHTAPKPETRSRAAG